MARERGPYSVAFPVNFTSKGDTTRDAFRKHMDEITRIYGILTGLDADTMDADTVSGIVNEQLKTHINSTAPHPNWTPTVSWVNVTNKPSLGDLSGNLSASRVAGSLSGATIPYGNVVGLKDFVQGLVPDSPSAHYSDIGYTDIPGTSIILQWGFGVITRQEFANSKETRYSTNFKKPFTSECSVVVAGTAFKGGGEPSELNVMMQVTEKTKTGFTYVPQLFTTAPNVDANELHCPYIAIGI